MEANRQRVSDLLDAQVSVSEVMDIVKCSKAFVYKVKAMKKTGKGFARKAGSGGHNKIVTDDFLVGLMAEIEADPTRSMRKLAKDLGVADGTIRKAVGMPHSRMATTAGNRTPRPATRPRPRRSGARTTWQISGRPTSGRPPARTARRWTMAYGAMLSPRRVRFLTGPWRP